MKGGPAILPNASTFCGPPAEERLPDEDPAAQDDAPLGGGATAARFRRQRCRPATYRQRPRALGPSSCSGPSSITALAEDPDKCAVARLSFGKGRGPASDRCRSPVAGPRCADMARARKAAASMLCGPEAPHGQSGRRDERGATTYSAGIRKALKARPARCRSGGFRCAPDSRIPRRKSDPSAPPPASTMPGRVRPSSSAMAEEVQTTGGPAGHQPRRRARARVASYPRLRESAGRAGHGAPDPALDAHFRGASGPAARQLRRGKAAPGRSCQRDGLAFAAIAETGTLMLTSGPETPSTLNFLPDTPCRRASRPARWCRPTRRAGRGLRRRGATMPPYRQFHHRPRRAPAIIEQRIQLGAPRPRDGFTSCSSTERSDGQLR